MNTRRIVDKTETVVAAPHDDALPRSPGGAWVSELMERCVRVYFRYALAVLFLWFGALKVLEASPIAPLVSRTLPFLPPRVTIIGLGWFEIAISILFLSHRTVRFALALLMLQLVGTFAPFVMAPELCFSGNPFFLTLEGEFIMKNLLIVGGALLLGGSLQPSHRPVSAPEIRK